MSRKVGKEGRLEEVKEVGRGTRQAPSPESNPPCRGAPSLNHTRKQGWGRGRERKGNGRVAAQPAFASHVRPGPWRIVVVVVSRHANAEVFYRSEGPSLNCDNIQWSFI